MLRDRQKNNPFSSYFIKLEHKRPQESELNQSKESLDRIQKREFESEQTEQEDGRSTKANFDGKEQDSHRQPATRSRRGTIGGGGEGRGESEGGEQGARR